MTFQKLLLSDDYLLKIKYKRLLLTLSNEDFAQKGKLFEMEDYMYVITYFVNISCKLTYLSLKNYFEP